MSASAATLLTARVAPLAAEERVLAVGFPGGVPAVADASGGLTLGGGDGPRRVRPHASGALFAVVDDRRIVTAGEDGSIIETGPDGTGRTLRVGGPWLDALTLGSDGAVAWSSGRQVAALSGKGELRELALPSAARGMAFLPKGYRLAISHYNGVSLWFPNATAAPEALVWKGSHIDATVSPDGRFVVTSMQENALHGWRLTDKAHMRMKGYPAKSRSLSWSHDGNWLATSGAEAAIIWPFSGKDGPMGKAPRECGVRPKRVSCVAFHPGSLMLAIGYEDGLVLLVRLTDASELLVRSETSAGAITAMAWDAKGARLLIGGADGYAGLLTLP
jgi:WD40 repeat protein